MNKEEIRAKIDDAKTVVAEVEEPFRSIAFEVLFRKLLEEGTPAVSTSRDLTEPLLAERMQVSEFLAQLDLRSQLDQAVAIAYHFLHRGQESSTRAEFLEAFAKARMARPKNLSDVIAKCIRRGHLVDAPQEKDGQKAWSITPTGERYIEERLGLAEQ